MNAAAPRLSGEAASASPRARRLARLVATQELFVRTRAPDSVRGGLRSVAQARSAWFGVGLSARRPSRGLPLDVLALVYAQEMIRRALELRHSIILIADTNALRAGMNELDIRRVCGSVQRTLKRTVDRLGFPVEVVKASEIASPREVASIRDRLAISSPYFAEQLAQMELMRRAGSGVKIGWQLSRASFDEAHFDRAFAARFPESPTFVYTIGGRSLDPRRPRACPYLCSEPDRRLLLSKDERIEAKLRPQKAQEASAARGYRRLLGKLARAHHRLTGKGDPRDPVATIQSLLRDL